ncbi:MAG: aminotransferase class III-fold pyridoxal phosphate-dependent enzyme, partial [Opitutaceae bacterium]|nr:aminotransferase class III-fold pyridoxal phosphate-dependent enzyme [Cytophagales bacterium]
MKILGLTQARIGSSRLPGKVLLKINNKTLLEYHLERAKKSRLVTKWIVATTLEQQAEKICSIATKLNIDYYQGDLYDVLDRFYQASKEEKPDFIVRITSDCPLIDPELIDRAITICLDNKLDYFYNMEFDSYPDGLDVEVFTFHALESAWKFSTEKADREHVTPYIRRNRSKGERLITSETGLGFDKYKNLRLTVDELPDLTLISQLIEALGGQKSWIHYADYILENRNMQNINSHLLRNEGYLKSEFEKIVLRMIHNFTASKLHKAAIHDLIPGGAHTYSKGDDQFPELAPAAIAYGKGSHLWDIDGNEFLDCSMGLTSVSLGHAYEPVVKRVKEELDKGVNFQRPSVLEREMAEKFLALVPEHDMIKFAKNGSIVTSAAVKLARAKTGRKLVAFPGDHPFYSYDDWFIGSTACQSGVPEEISSLSVTFKGCNLDSLKNLFAQYPGQIACVITEPEKNACGPGCDCKGNPGLFLKQAIDLAHENGALFIVDEMITGFKTAFPGSISKFKIQPDMATWGKGIANGFSFCALTGKKEVMELGGIRRLGEEKVFLISTTHGGETHAMAAALATIEEFQKYDVIKHLHATGNRIIELCTHLISKHHIENSVTITSSEWMPVFIFK